MADSKVDPDMLMFFEKIDAIHTTLVKMVVALNRSAAASEAMLKNYNEQNVLTLEHMKAREAREIEYFNQAKERHKLDMEERKAAIEREERYKRQLEEAEKKRQAAQN